MPGRITARAARRAGSAFGGAHTDATTKPFTRPFRGAAPRGLARDSRACSAISGAYPVVGRDRRGSSDGEARAAAAPASKTHDCDPHGRRSSPGGISLHAHDGHESGLAHRQRHSRSGHGRRGEGQLRPPRDADGDGRRRGDPLAAASPLQRQGPALARPGSLRPVGRPRLDAALLDAAPRRLRPVARRPQGLPPMAQQDPRAPRGRRHRGRGDDHRPPRPGLRQRRRHGARRTDGGGPDRVRAAQDPRHRHRLRRRPHGGPQPGGRVARGSLAPRQPPLHLRRQPDHDRRGDAAHLPRRRRHALPGAGLGRRPDGRT